MNPLIGGNVASKYNPQSSVPSGGSVSYAISDFIPDSNCTVTNGSVRLGWVCTAAGIPGTFQEARVLVANFGQITDSLAADVALNNAANYFDGPSVAQGTAGTWLATGTVSLQAGATASNFKVKLHDGTTVIASCFTQTAGAGQVITASLSGVLATPAGNLRISVKASATDAVMTFNGTGNSKDSTITAVRIG